MERKLSELANYLDSKIDILNNLSNDYKENSNEYFLCEHCDEYIHGSKLEWKNDTPICPECNNIIKL